MFILTHFCLIRPENTGKTFGFLMFSGGIKWEDWTEVHCVKAVRIRSFLVIFSPNAGKYGPEKLRIRTLFTQRWVSFNDI